MRKFIPLLALVVIAGGVLFTGSPAKAAPWASQCSEPTGCVCTTVNWHPGSVMSFPDTWAAHYNQSLADGQCWIVDWFRPGPRGGILPGAPPYPTYVPFP